MPVIVTAGPPAPGTTHPTTVGSLIADTRRHLLGSGRAEMNRITANVGLTDTTITFDFDLAGITRGVYVAIEDEIVYVWSTTPGTRQAVVQRGQLGTTATAHTGPLVVEVNPRFPNYDIRLALQEEIRSWGPQVFRVVSSLGVGTVSSVRGYDLSAINAGSFYAVLDVRRSYPTTPATTDPKTRPRLGFTVDQAVPLDVFPSGKAIFLTQGFGTTALPTIDIVAAVPFAVEPFDDAVDAVGSVGLAPEWLDIPPLGAAVRLLETREVRRTLTEAQGEPREAAEVPPGFIGSAAQRLKIRRDSRLADAQRQLMAQYPVRAA